MECLYYTDGLIHNRSTLAKLCLLFEKVHTFFLSPSYFLDPLEEKWEREKNEPFFKTAPIDINFLTRPHNDRVQDFIKDTRELIDESVLAPMIIEQTPPDWEGFEANEAKLMKEGFGIVVAKWGELVGLIPKGDFYLDAPYYSIYRWQSIAGGLHYALERELIPISDDAGLSALAIETVNKLSSLTHLPTVDEIASNIAMRVMSLVLPNLPALTPAETLELRENLHDELTHFRSEMRSFVEKVDQGTPDAVDHLIKNSIQPRLSDLELKVKSLSGKLFNKIARSLAVGIPAILSSFFLDLPISPLTPVSALGIDLCLNIHKNIIERREQLRNSRNRWLVYLLELKKL